jgi:hypothetical protein
MNRSLKQIRLTDGENKYVSRIEDEPSAQFTIAAKIRQVAVLTTLATTPGLTDCGTLPFQTLKMWHDGNRWIIELEAVGN